MIIELDVVPPYSEVERVYGDPDTDSDDQFDKAWLEERTKVFDLPFTLIPSWNRAKLIKRLRFHRLVGPAIVDALRDIGDFFGPKITKGEWNIFGGGLHLRTMISGPLLSTHSYGIAIDLNNDKACWQCDPTAQHSYIVDAFKARGFIWGGDWEAPYEDGMHFQACRG